MYSRPKAESLLAEKKFDFCRFALGSVGTRTATEQVILIGLRIIPKLGINQKPQLRDNIQFRVKICGYIAMLWVHTVSSSPSADHKISHDHTSQLSKEHERM